MKSNIVDAVVKIGAKRKKQIQVRAGRLVHERTTIKKAVKKQRNKKELTKIKHAVELKRINNQLAKGKIKKTIILDSGTKVKINAEDRSIWIAGHDGENDIAMPIGSYAYQDNLIIVDPEGIIKEVKAKPKDVAKEQIQKELMSKKSKFHTFKTI